MNKAFVCLITVKIIQNMNLHNIDRNHMP